jgi:hypothetical protein
MTLVSVIIDRHHSSPEQERDMEILTKLWIQVSLFFGTPTVLGLLQRY